MSPDPRLSVCIVTYNNARTIEACLAATARAAGGMPIEVRVVDNASADGTADILRRHPEVQWTAEPVNRGFGAACNRAMRGARGEYLLFLNPDTEPAPGSVARLLEHVAAHPEIGLAGPRFCDPAGEPRREVRRFPTFRSALYQFTALRYLGLFSGSYRAYRCEGFDYVRAASVEQIMGAAMLGRREVLDRLGGFDERFFMYYEDVDLCLRVRQAGLEVAYVPEAEVRHAAGHSAEQAPRLVLCQRLCSLMKFFAKHRGRTALFRALFLPLLLLRLAGEAPVDALRAARYAVTGDRRRCARKLGHARSKLQFLLGDWLKVARA